MKKLINLGRSRRKRRGESGQTLVEFALVSLVFFLVVFGIFDGTRLFESWVAVQHASREGARYAVTGRIDCDYGTGDRNACIIGMAKAATEGLNGGGLDGADVSVTYKSWDYPDYAGSGTPNFSGVQCDAIEVRVAYTHHFVLPFFQALAPSGISIAGTQRMVNEPFGPCT